MEKLQVLLNAKKPNSDTVTTLKIGGGWPEFTFSKTLTSFQIEGESREELLQKFLISAYLVFEHAYHEGDIKYKELMLDDYKAFKKAVELIKKQSIDN